VRVIACTHVLNASISFILCCFRPPECRVNVANSVFSHQGVVLALPGIPNSYATAYQYLVGSIELHAIW